MTESTALPASTVSAAPRAKRSWLWLPVALVILYWTLKLLADFLDAPTFIRFMVPAAAGALMTLVVPIWWLFYKRVSMRERFLVLGAAVLAGVVAAQLAHKDFKAGAVMMTGLPFVISAWVLYLVCAARFSQRVWLPGVIAAVSLPWIPFDLVRMEGLTGGVAADLHWRWTPTAEELFLAEHAKRSTPKTQAEAPSAAGVVVKLQPGDWPAFRGPTRDGVVRDTHVATDWSATPPKQVWRQRAGAGWSSMIIVDGRLYTQEQRGAVEVVACLDAKTGSELWVRKDQTRYSDEQSGAGPRGTPTFVAGYVVALGANGVLNCLDAATGAVKWSRNVITESGAKVPAWGVSSSPLIMNDLVIVYSGDGSDKNLLAYKLDSGAPVWNAASGSNTYVSPEQAVLHGVPQVLHWSNKGLISVEPATGKTLWTRETPATGGAWRAIQPHVFGSSVLVSSDEFGTRIFDIALDKDKGAWTATERAYDIKLRGYFNDYAIHEGHIYGFNNGKFCCVDLATGKRKWNGSSYGAGQMILLADQALIIVLSESGEVVLLQATPEKNTELGRFQAIEGKTWNHPALAHGRLYVRNGEGMASYDVGGGK